MNAVQEWKEWNMMAEDDFAAAKAKIGRPRVRELIVKYGIPAGLGCRGDAAGGCV